PLPSVMIDRLTALVLTYNEAPNIERTLAGLAWAHRIVVVDSFSDDGTVEAVRSHPRVRLVQRPFDSFAEQSNFGLDQIETEWVLALDADYVCGPELAAEIEKLDGSCVGYAASFVYCIGEKNLRGTLYPPRVILFRSARAR